MIYIFYFVQHKKDKNYLCFLKKGPWNKSVVHQQISTKIVLEMERDEKRKTYSILNQFYAQIYFGYVIFGGKIFQEITNEFPKLKDITIHVNLEPIFFITN